MANVLGKINRIAPAAAGKTGNTANYNSIDIDGFPVESVSFSASEFNNRAFIEVSIQFKAEDLKGEPQGDKIYAHYKELQHTLDNITPASIGDGKGVATIKLTATSTSSEGKEITTNAELKNLVGSIDSSGLIIRGYATQGSGKCDAVSWIDIPAGCNSVAPNSTTTIGVY
jgi:hypothetical protein